MFAVENVLSATPDISFDFLTACVASFLVAWALCDAFHGWLHRHRRQVGPRRSVFDMLPQVWFIALLVVWLGSAFVDYRPSYFR